MYARYLGSVEQEVLDVVRKRQYLLGSLTWSSSRPHELVLLIGVRSHFFEDASSLGRNSDYVAK